jgi:AraC-like DNA-binding protein
MSARTLQRRLESLNLNFRDVLRKTQERAAKQYLADASLPIAEVAAKLGYANRSSFELAFRRWTGQSPYRYRHARQASPAHVSAAALSTPD